MSLEVNSVVKVAYDKAIDIRRNAYAPYSSFLVGAAVKFIDQDEIFVGCNIENASYGACICAEQVAITQGISKTPNSRLDFLILATDTNPAACPCGICLQIMNEFATKNFMIYLANLQGIQAAIPFREIMTISFNRSYMTCPNESTDGKR